MNPKETQKSEGQLQRQRAASSRQLSRLSLPPDILNRLSARHVLTVKDLYSRTVLDLVELLDLPFHIVTGLLQDVAAAVVPKPVTALEVLRQAEAAPRYLRTTLTPLDSALLGGLPAGSITEVVGPAGIGKTQFCLGMCIIACLDRLSEEGRVLYIDTERKFSGERLAQIARARFPESFARHGAVTTMLDRVLVKAPDSSAKLLELLEGLQGAIIDLGIKLVIIDSIASLARSDFGAGNIAERQRLLGSQASRLKYLAESFRIPVLVTNQVTTSMNKGAEGGTTVTAALGPMWAHAVNTRLVLASLQDARGQQLRVLIVAKSPSAPNMSLAYQVTAAGIEWLEGVEPPPIPPGSVVDMTINNFQAYEGQAGDGAGGGGGGGEQGPAWW